MRSKQSDIEALLKKARLNDAVGQGKHCKFPEEIKPMLATLVDKPVEDEGWLYEIKWDGYRALSYIINGKVEIKFSSFKTSFTHCK